MYSSNEVFSAGAQAETLLNRARAANADTYRPWTDEVRHCSALAVPLTKVPPKPRRDLLKVRRRTWRERLALALMAAVVTTGYVGCLGRLSGHF